MFEAMNLVSLQMWSLRPALSAATRVPFHAAFADPSRVAATAVPGVCDTTSMAADKGYVFVGCADGRVMRVLERGR